MSEVDIFNAEADAGFDEGWSEGSAGGNVSVTGLVEARFCHGIDIGVDIAAAAEANAHLRLLILGADALVGATAHAGVRGRVTIDSNIFKSFGVTAQIEAAAEVAAQARLSIGLETDYIAELAANELNGLALELFLAFLRETSIGGGVYGKVAYSAMAKGWAKIAGKFSDDKDAGFTIGGGYAVGLKGGYGMDWYAKVGFENPRRFFNASVKLIIDEIVAELHQKLPLGSDVAIELFRLLVPIGLTSAYEVGQKSLTEGLGSPEEIIKPFISAFTEELQQYLIDKVVKVVSQALTELVDEALLHIADKEIDDLDRTKITESVGQFRVSISDNKFDPEDIDELIHLVSLVCELASQEMVQRVKRPISILWTAVVSSIAMRDAVSVITSASVSVIGYSLEGSTRIRKMPAVSSMPVVVLEDYLSVVDDFDGTQLSFDHAMDYLVEVGISPILIQRAPEMVLILDGLYNTTGITPGNIITFTIQGTLGNSVAETEFYQEIRDFIRSMVNEVIHEGIFSRFDQVSSSNSDASIYMKEVAKPSVNLMVSFLFDKLDQVIGDPSLVSQAQFSATIQSGASVLLYKILARNLVVIEQIASNTVRKQIVSAMGELESTVRSNRASVLVESTVDNIDTVLKSISQYLPNFPSASGLSDDQLDALQEFIAEILNISQEALGDTVFTDERWNKRRNSMRDLMLSLDSNFSWDDLDSIEDQVQELMECFFIPNEGAVKELFDVHIDLLSAQGEVLLRRIPVPLSKLILVLTMPMLKNLGLVVEQVELKIREALDKLQDTLSEHTETIEKLTINVNEALQDIDNYLYQGLSKITNWDVEDISKSLISIGKRNIRGVADDLEPNNPFRNAIYSAADVFEVTFGVASIAFNPVIDEVLIKLRNASNLRSLVESISATVSPQALMQNNGRALIKPSIVKKINKELLNISNTALDHNLINSLKLEINILFFGDIVALKAEDFINIIGEGVADLLEVNQLADVIIEHLYLKSLLQWNENQKQITLSQEIVKKSEYNAVRSREGETSIIVHSPISMDTYSPAVPIKITIDNVGSAWAGNGNTQRIQITGNGKLLKFPQNSWQYNKVKNKLSLNSSMLLNSGYLQSGLNILEISITNGKYGTTRKMVAFLVDPSKQTIPGYIYTPIGTIAMSIDSIDVGIDIIDDPSGTITMPIIATPIDWSP